MAAFNREVNYKNNLMKSTFKTDLITEIMQAITHEVIRKNETVYIIFLILNFSIIFLILFTIFGHECILRLQRLMHCSWSNDGENFVFLSNAMDFLQQFTCLPLSNG